MDDRVKVFERAKELLLGHDMMGFADLWAVDGTMEFPFAPPGRPRLLEGREAVRAYVRDYTDHIDLRAVAHEVVHLTEDPGVLIVEFSMDAVAVGTGRPLRPGYVAVITVRDGEIASYRDYWNPLMLNEMSSGSEEGRTHG
ncbi:nuclear transport factor 2 family protein [Streptomyces sp. 110]|uniref:Nuclear transport factor 2 family protein n=1 Tax=Streptomyces endocoffeicus TaxID=2898945 RepID=A0ABS1PI82_9ACTN|nr:nuclear transport factor 2 family protein [Streptomyces endocoffeicus]MBL1112113.1 nuclear transport factor 2 family protein [Streptomyces endocoffeicus]